MRQSPRLPTRPNATVLSRANYLPFIIPPNTITAAEIQNQVELGHGLAPGQPGFVHGLHKWDGYTSQDTSLDCRTSSGHTRNCSPATHAPHSGTAEGPAETH